MKFKIWVHLSVFSKISKVFWKLQNNSRDNINDYKKKEIDYSNEGIKLRQYNEHYVNKDDDDSDGEDDWEDGYDDNW